MGLVDSPLLFVGDLIPPLEWRSTVSSDQCSIIANLETALTYQTPQGGKASAFGCSPDLAENLVEQGIKVVSLANNHILDCGSKGVLDTLRTLTKVGVQIVGAGINRIDALTPVILQMGSRRIALLAFLDGTLPESTDCYIATFRDFIEILIQARLLRDEGFVPVVIVHWGVEYTCIPSPRQKKIARELVESGARFVIGHHPHVIQGHEQLGDAAIFYSLGNFNMDTSILREGSNLGLGVKLVDENLAQDRVAFRIRKDRSVDILEGSTQRRFCDRFEKLSHVAAMNIPDMLWREIFAQAYFRTHIPAFKTRMQKYGIRQIVVFIHWLMIRETVAWAIAYLISRIR